jgi:hypothetical protein
VCPYVGQAVLSALFGKADARIGYSGQANGGTVF